MSDSSRKQTLKVSRLIENFVPPTIAEKVVHDACASAADAFLGQIEYGKDYMLKTDLLREDWADGFGVKYTYYLSFEPLVRCRDCVYYMQDPDPIDPGWPMMCERTGQDMLEPDGFCACGEEKEKEAVEVWQPASEYDVTCYETDDCNE